MGYSIALFCAFFMLIPPINFALPAPDANWPFFILLVAFAGIHLCFLKVHAIVKFISVAMFISCFFSTGPYLSFNQYFTIVICCYLYYACTFIKDWTPVFRTALAVLGLNVILFCFQMQLLDKMLNFGHEKVLIFGSIGHHMQAGSFSVMLTALLVQISPWFLVVPILTGIFCNSVWAILCGVIGIGLWFRPPKKYWVGILGVCLLIGFVTGKIAENTHQTNGRSLVWAKTIELTNKKPLTGYGPGMYKVLFHPMSGIKAFNWKTAHNCWLQMAFEIGWPLTILLWGAYLILLAYLWYIKERALLIGAVLIGMDMFVHFPTRQLQCVPLFILFFAYCEYKLKHPARDLY